LRGAHAAEANQRTQNDPSEKATLSYHLAAPFRRKGYIFASASPSVMFRTAGVVRQGMMREDRDDGGPLFLQSPFIRQTAL
jgi:hypothetical protein